MKRILSAVLAIAMLAFSLAGCGAEKTSDSTKPSSTEKTTEAEKETPKELPASIDLRNYNGKNYVTPPKYQIFGDCGSFGIAGAAEISYLYANDLGVPAGEVNNNVNFSEKYITWYIFHNITKDDVMVGKVRKSQVGEGYDLSEAERQYADAAYGIGGISYAGANLFASGFTPVDESVTVNGERPYFYSGKYSKIVDDEVIYSEDDDWSIPLTAEYRNPYSNAFVRDSIFLPSPASYDENGKYKFNQAGVDAIKSEIAKGHGVSFAALVYGKANYENWAVYNSTNNANHVITIVGYDDNYPKENFTRLTDDGKVDEESIPPTDGAFIIKDSKGESAFEETGCFYMSYYDQSIAYPISFDLEKSDDVTCRKPNYDQYDMLMIGWSAQTDYDCETKIANVFDAEENETLYQISYKTNIPNTSVHYEIYKSPKEGRPDSGVLLEQGDSTHQWSGYHKLDLQGKYELEKGEKYSVVLTLSYTTKDGVTQYTDVIPYACSLPRGVKANSVINKGESYLYTDSKWTDLCTLKDTFAKQAYKQNGMENLPDNFKARSIDDIVVDNFPIKAILIPENEN